MNLRDVDLNLLVVLDALLDEAHVTRAARRIGLSQPATSAALERCRQLFDDALLIRGKGGMTLTPKADRLHHRVKRVLDELGEVLERRDEELASIHQTVRLSMSDTHVALVAPALRNHLDKVASGIDLVFIPWLGPGAAQEQLAQGGVDIAISQFPQLGAGFVRRELSDEDYTVIMRRGHPLREHYDLDYWLAWPHVIVSGRGETSTGLDQLLHSLGRHRRVAMVVPTFALACQMVRNTDLVATLPTHALPDAAADELELRAPPVAVAGYKLHMAWHRRLEHDQVTRYVAGYIEREIFGQA